MLEARVQWLEGRRCELELLLGEFVHEAQQPLTAVQNFVAAAAHRLATAPTLAPLAGMRISQDLDSALEELGHLQEQMRRVRANLRAGAAVPEPGWMVAAVSRAHGRISSNPAVHEMAFPLDLPPEDCRIAVAECRIELVVENLLRNACEAIRGEGSAEGSPGGVRSGVVGTAVRIVGDRAILRITDDGPGVDPEVRDLVTRPFFSSKEGGLGLGLSLCRAVVERAGGRIRLEPAVPRGLVVICEFPLIEEREMTP